ncbi:MAG: cupin domain-containing protein [Candidatus Solibacter sp.]
MSTAIIEARRAGFVSEPGEGRPIHVLGSEIVVRIASVDVDNAFTVFEGQVAPQDGPPMHRHLHQDEVWHVRKGEFRFVVDGQEIHARAGDTVYGPRGVAHTFQNTGSTPGTLLTTVVPGGLDEFFEEVEMISPRGVAPDPAKLAPVLKKWGQELLGPPLRALPAERVESD